MRAVAILLAAALPLQAQLPSGTVTGIVTDSASAPIAGAEVIVRPGARRTFTDSVGRFIVGRLDPGPHTITARKLGWVSKTTDFELSKTDAGLRLNFSLVHHVHLDTVRVSATRTCSGLKLTGFECRRSNGNGLFLDFPDIDDLQRFHAAEIFRDLPGFRVVMRRSSGGIVPAVTPQLGRCLLQYVDGMPPSVSNPLPERATDLAAVEVYQHPDSMPLTDRRVLYRALKPGLSRNCQVILYWTGWDAGSWRPLRPIRATDEQP